MKASDASEKVTGLINSLHESKSLFDQNDTYDFPLESQLNACEEAVNDLDEALEEALG